MLLSRLLTVLAVAAPLLLAACGGDNDEAAEAQSTPARAVKEIGAVRSALDDAMASLAKGDRAAAGEAVAEGYVDHFEHVEGPLDKVDHELNEKLEEAISTDLRAKVKDAPRPEVRALVRSIRADLDTAERKLK